MRNDERVYRAQYAVFALMLLGWAAVYASLWLGPHWWQVILFTVCFLIAATYEVSLAVNWYGLTTAYTQARLERERRRAERGGKEGDRLEQLRAVPRPARIAAFQLLWRRILILNLVFTAIMLIFWGYGYLAP
jgi:hypothetical protein